MKFSYEEIFLMYGQYDTFVSLELDYGSESHEKFGQTLIGEFIFQQHEKEEFENIKDKENIPRTNRKVRFKPSKLQKLTSAQIEELDRFGINCSDIAAVSSADLSRENRFATTGKKEIPNTSNIYIKGAGNWRMLNKMKFGFLHSRFSKGEPLSPNEYFEYFGLRKYFGFQLDKQSYLENAFDEDGVIKERVRYYELQTRFNECVIKKEEIAEYASLLAKDYLYKDSIIYNEIKRSSQNISKVVEKYGDEIINLKQICRGFSERVLLFGPKIIFLDFERFVHIYTRHVGETQIGEKFTAEKTIFQYKFEDIMRLISIVLDSIRDEIFDHFKNNPDKNFRRMGTRSVYFDGHYYRIEIEPIGKLRDFHPYNVKE